MSADTPVPEPVDGTSLEVKSFVRSANLDGPWLILFQPRVPDGWVVGRVEVTARGNVQVEIKSKRGGVT